MNINDLAARASAALQQLGLPNVKVEEHPFRLLDLLGALSSIPCKGGKTIEERKALREEAADALCELYLALRGKRLPADVHEAFVAFTDAVALRTPGRDTSALHSAIFDALDAHCAVNWDGYAPPRTDDRWAVTETHDALDVELVRARTKFPGRRFLLAALAEEVGELAEAIHVDSAGEAVKKEALQVAAMALRIYEEGDATRYHIGGLHALICGVGQIARKLLQRKCGVPEALEALEDTAASMLERWQGRDPTFADVTDEEARP